MNYLIFDAIILVVLLVFAFVGRHRGLILSLFSLLALLVAIGGGLIVSKHLTPAVTDWVYPLVEDHVTSAVQSALPEEVEGDHSGLFNPEMSEKLSDLLENLSPETIQDTLNKTGIELPKQVQNFLLRMSEEERSALADSGSLEEFASAAAEKAVRAVVRVVLFLLCFVLILILWNILAKALDLVARLPVLKTMNKLGGFLFGVARGALFLFIVAGLLNFYPTVLNSLIPPETLEQTYLVRFFLNAQPLEFLASL